MTQLFIDGKLAIPNKSASFKLTKENVYFTKSSSYTFEIELPLNLPENRKIFGFIDRIDISKENLKLDAKIVIDNVTVLIGEANVTSVTQNSVKVQLLGEAACYNYGTKVNDWYIDQIDLGDWYWETWPDGSYIHYERGLTSSEWLYYDEGTKISSAYNVLLRAYYKGPEHGDDKYSEAEVLEKLRKGYYGWVAYPTYNATAEMRHNAIAWKETGQDSKVFNAFLRHYEGEKGSRQYSDKEPVKASFSIQPFIWRIVEIVAKATGFIIDRNDNALFNDPLFNKIFIANTNTSAEIRSCLPHWTVNEFWTQIENTFGLVMSVDYSSKKIRLLKRKDHYKNAKVRSLNFIVEEHDSTIDDDSQEDISVSNVGYAEFDSNPEDVLAEDITANAEIMNFDSTADLFNWCQEQTDLSSKKNVIFDCKDGRQFIYSTDVKGAPGIIEVNMLRPRIKNAENNDVEISLKIVPAKYSMQKSDIFAFHSPSAGITFRDIPDATFDVLMLQVPGQEAPELDNDYSDVIDIQAIIEGEEEAQSDSDTSNDLMYMAIANPLLLDDYDENIDLQREETVNYTFSYPRAFLRERCYAQLTGVIGFMDEGQSLSLIEIGAQNNLAMKTITDLVTIRTNVKHCFRFISATIPDPGDIFLIRNKRFVCEKIEVTIKPEGFCKMMTGYFYDFES